MIEINLNEMSYDELIEAYKETTKFISLLEKEKDSVDLKKLEEKKK